MRDEGVPDWELCDVCARILDPLAEARFAVVPDSSAVRMVSVCADGWRLVVACGEQHLRELIAAYQARPWIPAELWAGRVERAWVTVPVTGRMTVDVLAARTGLSQVQVRAGVWLWRQRLSGRWPPPGLLPA
ncbi:hypothetical protein M8C13_05245 [Crossiella sp. SN42]|uniref:hypothetical protein n=1 Tax=Crossiella sp. SN42 TaxID=2944808 RepID=UPI00207D2A22|nr:hypothetical protein [Crossiella sp. SN42]MCO1575164.1 hypothetical protein [Crossiella sp. SN42]